MIFTETTRPNEALFYHRDDANDPRLGEVVRYTEADYEASDVVLLGLPQDEGVRRNKGRLGAADAPDAIRTCLYRLGLGLGFELADVRLFDLGNTRIDGDLEVIHARHQAIVEQVIRDGKRLIVLGGGNDTSFPDCAGVSTVAGKVLGFNLDAHYDVRADQPRNSGTPYRQLLEIGYLDPNFFCEVGSQPYANSAIYHQYLVEKGVNITPADTVKAYGMNAILEELLREKRQPAIFWGLDMDVVASAFAPGVSAPNPNGLSADDACVFAWVAGQQPQTRLFEITEVNPRYDVDDRTCRLAGLVIWHFLVGLMYQTQ